MDTIFNTDTILVSCYYLVEPKPGRSHEKYKEWFNYMIKSLVTPPRYDLLKNKGYGTEKHMSALKQYGPIEGHRFSYKPVQLYKI